MEIRMRQSFHGMSESVTCVLMLANTRLATVLKAFVVLVLCPLVGRTSRALEPCVDEIGRLLRDCVAHLRKGLRCLFGRPGRYG